MIPKEERIPRSFRGELYQLLHAPEEAYTAGFILTRRAEGPLTRVLLVLWLPLTVFRVVLISSLLHYVPGNQKDLPNTSPDRNARLFVKDVRVLKREGKKTLPKQAWCL